MGRREETGSRTERSWRQRVGELRGSGVWDKG